MRTGSTPFNISRKLPGLNLWWRIGILDWMQVIPQRTEVYRMVFRPYQFALTYWPPLLILLVGAVADAITTWRNLRQYGIQAEAHPVQRWCSEIAGVDLGVPMAKLAQVLFVLLVAAWWRPWTPWILTLCGLLYSAAAVSNHYALL